MNGAHLASPVRGELGYAHWPLREGPKIEVTLLVTIQIVRHIGAYMFGLADH